MNSLDRMTIIGSGMIKKDLKAAKNIQILMIIFVKRRNMNINKKLAKCDVCGNDVFINQN